jgi:hypothetical protein
MCEASVDSLAKVDEHDRMRAPVEEIGGTGALPNGDRMT